MTRAAVRLTLDCSNRCVFCAQAGVPRAGADAVPSGASEVTFVGGEPTLLGDELVAAVRDARAAGAKRVGVQTNGARLAELAGALADAGLTDVHVSLHGATAAVHDYHTGVAGSFDALLAGVAAARARGLVVAATTLLTRSSFRVVGELPRLLAQRGVAAWTIALPHAAGRAVEAFDRVMPRLGLALPFALHALDAARKLGLPAWIQGAPLCALGPFARRALPAAPRAFAEPCDGCAAREGCPGLDSIYLMRFGGDELSRRSEPIAADPGDDALRRLFVGPGELAPPPPELQVPESPRAARAGLPLLGKVRPAAGEVRKASDRKSGEALREVFPELFERVPK